MSPPKLTTHLDAFAFPPPGRRMATGTTAHSLVERRVERDPSAIAVVCDDRTLSYGELNARANRLARELRLREVGPESTVGILLERSPEWIVAMLGVLKAGGACVPLDPDDPPSRRRHIVTDAGMRVLISRNGDRIASGLPAGVEVLDLDAEEEAIRRHGASNPVPRASPRNLAYVIHTSSSTGLPKGVMVEHRNLVHSARARLESYDERVGSLLVAYPFAFGSSVAGIFWTLVQGGRLVLPPKGSERDPAAVGDLVHRHRISHVDFLPSLHRAVLESTSPERLRFLRVAIVGGEECLPAVVDAHRSVVPGAALFNEYGSTETTVGATVHRADEGWTGGRVPIGRPIARTRIHLLDAGGRPVPEGDPGEIHVAGSGVVRGYMSRPDLTEERFPKNPFGKGRLYRTGDVARVRPDGALEFLGREDRQVKMGGFRVELEESGKIERKALPDPLDARPVIGVEYEGPRDPAEAAVIEAWVETLPVDRVGRQDNYFDLGGNSVLLPQTISRLSRRGLEMSPGNAFRHPTAAEWARIASLVVPAKQPDPGPLPGPRSSSHAAPKPKLSRSNAL